ncbi:glycosyltransferase family 4 protein [Flavimaricola marinus]|uniref:Glycosyl transferases group 1 n=1 Tax=Flavimaricola marinus TaxID=1819565 RepID=A0A238LCH3_9RHOB|nr:glycosyltransferase family 1 protein [Flavimaricola marinus]SMY07104.1 Glycosyl transferases group 1 [Flavimaricola marinus]
MTRLDQTERPLARLLDLTRLVSRAGRVLTGVDRVEREYAFALLDDAVPVWGLVHTALGYVLLDESGIRTILHAGDTGDWGTPDLLSQLSRRLDPKRQAGQSFARRHAVRRATTRGLGRMLRGHLPAGTACLNVGHSNLGSRSLAALRSIPQSRVIVMIHDTIPLDHPEMQRDGTVSGFAAKLQRVGQMADLILCPSEVSKSDILRHIGQPAPPVLAVPLGVRPTVPKQEELPAGLDLSTPYFVSLGTIEPRKNHALLLDIWDELGGAGPRLFICGSRGWNNEAVFARLDAKPAGVTELAGLSDGAVAALLAGSNGLLFPSVAEGFGLPLAEAAALGVPVICGDLAICREVLGQSAVYLPVTDRYLWKNTIEDAADNRHQRDTQRVFDPPTWDEHFKNVLMHC